MRIERKRKKNAQDVNLKEVGAGLNKVINSGAGHFMQKKKTVLQMDE